MTDFALIIIAFILHFTIGGTIVMLFLKYYIPKIINNPKYANDIEPLITENVKLVDIIILNEPLNIKKLKIFPVLEDRNKKIYLLFGKYAFGNYKKEIKIKKPLEIKLITDKKYDIQKNQMGLACIDKKINKVEIKDEFIIIDNKKYEYGGNISNATNFYTNKSVIYNLYHSDFKNLINGATLYSGIIEFDDLMEGKI